MKRLSYFYKIARFTEDEQEKILSYLEQGLTYKEIEIKMGLNPNTINRYKYNNPEFAKKVDKIFESLGKLRRSYTQEVLNQILSLLEQELTYSEVEAKMNLPNSTINYIKSENNEFSKKVDQILKEQGRQKRKYTQEDKNRILELLKEGLSFLEIESELEFPPNTISQLKYADEGFSAKIDEILTQQNRKPRSFTSKDFQNALNLIEQGYSFTEAEKLLKFPDRTISYFKQINEEFATKVDMILQQQDVGVRKLRETDTQDAIFKMLEDGYSFVQIETKLGLLPNVIKSFKYKDEDFSNKVNEILERRKQKNNKDEMNETNEKAETKIIPYSRELHDKIITLLESGISMAETERRLQLPPDTIRNLRRQNPELKNDIRIILDERNVKRSKEDLDEQDIQAILNYLQRGYSINQIEQGLKLVPGSIRELMQEDSNFAMQVQKISKPVSNLDDNVKQKIVDLLLSGYTIEQAGEQLDIPINDIYAAKYIDKIFSDDVELILRNKGHLPNKMKKEFEDQILLLLNNNLTLQQAAEKLNIPFSSLQYYMTKFRSFTIKVDALLKSKEARKRKYLLYKKGD